MLARMRTLKGMKTMLFSIALLVFVQNQFAAEPQAGRDRFVAHEWGTFTSVQGADGIQLEWNPFVAEELPSFVYQRKADQARAGLDLLAKNAFVALQRMETPVIYFYSDRERSVDVRVKFPQGAITEWYPQVAKPKEAPLFWDDVRILPRSLPGVLSCSEPSPQDPLPKEASGSHYYAARETDADLLRVSLPDGKVEHEKFLFYRGVGNFVAPLKVTTDSATAQLQLWNTGGDALTHLYVLHMRNGTGKFIYLPKLAAGESQAVKLELEMGRMAASDVQAGISSAMRKTLESEGLYAAEAAAMVKTWHESWFGEEGLRVLYVLPRAWTDRTLPLGIEPAPSEIERVMVGRAEVITPEVEWKILKQIARFSESDEGSKVKAMADLQSMKVGRFADAIVRRWLGKTPSAEFSKAGWGLLERMNAAERANTLAQR